MSKLHLIKDPILFQGEKYLSLNKQYFEGWYFKNTNSKDNISFIPGITMDKNKKLAFIQIITNSSSYFIPYDIKDFKYDSSSFNIQILNNVFTKEKIHIDIKDDTQSINIFGNIEYSNSKNIKTNLLSPNIMGPFSYLPFMECNHAIISMQNSVNGLLNINNKEMLFNNDLGYIEKDWGYSFPNNYIWCQANNFKNPNASFMLSIASIPFKIFTFNGIICSLIIDNVEFKFTTYNNAKLIKYNVTNDSIDISLKKGNYFLNITSQNKEKQKLYAPVRGKMNKNIFESISSIVSVTLKKNDNVIFYDTSQNCGLEIVEK